MSSYLDKLKRQSQSGNFDKLAQKLKDLNSNSDYDDNRESYWSLTTDKAGNGMAEIRFLPAPEVDGEDALPSVKYHSHGFEVNGWYIEYCPTTQKTGNKPCPACESNNELWNSGLEANKNIARNRKRKLNFVSNIYVVSDPKNPENEGKVFLFRYGKMIYDMIQDAQFPQFDDQKPFNPFDLWTGANFKLRSRKADGFIKYDKSTWGNPGPLTEDESELEKILSRELSLQAEIADNKYKPYDKLKTRLDKVLGTSTGAKTTVETLKAAAPKSKVMEDENDSPPFDPDPTNAASDDEVDFSALLDD